MCEIIGRIHSFETFGAVDGPGVRFIVFMQGCLLRCLYCHNPDTWSTNGGTSFTPSALVNKIVGYKSFILKGGVTFSGGEPLLQADFVEKTIHLLKSEGLHTSIDTSGAVPLKLCHKAVEAADLLLLDIKDIDSSDCQMLTGQDNSNALALLSFCQKINKPVWIRQVLLPKYTLNDEKLHRLGSLLSSFSCIEKVELLPFHKMGEYKWDILGERYELTELSPPTPEEIVYAKEIVKSYALSIE